VSVWRICNAVSCMCDGVCMEAPRRARVWVLDAREESKGTSYAGGIIEFEWLWTR
jgi:hypothetical protein